MNESKVFGRAFESLVRRGEVSEYLAMLDEVSLAVEQVEGTRLDVLLGHDPQANEHKIRLAVTLGDLVCLYPEPDAVLLAPAERYPINAELLDVFPGLSSAVRKHENLKVLYGFAPMGEAMSELEPWAIAGRLVVRPLPMLSYGPLQLVTEPSVPGLLVGGSRISDRSRHLSLSDANLATRPLVELKAVQIPFLHGIPMDQLLVILEDESELLQDLRSELREFIGTLPADALEAETRVADTIRPAVARVERRFKSISQMHSLRIMGASLGTTALTLVALSGSATATALSAILGSAGLTVLANEVADLVKSRADLREMPFYCLWKIARNARRYK